MADPYERLYYSGVLNERRAKSQLRAGRSPHAVRVLFEQALQNYDEAAKRRPKGNGEAILRWKRCVRLLKSLKESEWEAAAVARRWLTARRFSWSSLIDYPLPNNIWITMLVQDCDEINNLIRDREVQRIRESIKDGPSNLNSNLRKLQRG